MYKLFLAFALTFDKEVNQVTDNAECSSSLATDTTNIGMHYKFYLKVKKIFDYFLFLTM